MNAAFYGAQVGKAFPSRRTAAEHFVQNPGRANLLFHPLISPLFLPGHVREAWDGGRMADVLDYLFSPSGVVRAWSTLFDPMALPDREGVPREVLVRKYFGSIPRTRELPPRPELLNANVAWGRARDEIIAAAAAIRGHKRLVRPRIKTHWNQGEEREWLAAVPAPVSSDGEVIVSIVMPVWNRASRVRDAIGSVRAQTFSSWELIVVDDGSTDESLQVLRDEAVRDPRIVVLAEAHAGVSAARNAALAVARGSYVAFLDSDNTWRSHFLATMVGAMQSGGLRAAYSGTRLVKGDGITYRAFAGGLAELQVVNHIDLNVLVVETRLAREAGGFDTELRRWVDHDFALRVARIAEPTLLPFIGCDYDDDGSVNARITTTEHEHWQFVALAKSLTDWESLSAQVAERVVGRVSVVIPVYQDVSMTTAALRAVVEYSREFDVEVVVLDNGSKPTIALELAALAMAYPQVKLVRLPRNLHFATGCNVGFAQSTGEYVVFLNNDTEVREGWLPPLIERLSDPAVCGVQPLLLYPDDTIQACGTVFPARETPPVHLLAGYPREDAEVTRSLQFHAVTAAALAMRAGEFVKLRGFDPIYVNGLEDVDLCLRAGRDLGGHFVVEPSSVVTHKESKTPGRGLAIQQNRAIFLERWRGSLPGPERAPFEAAGLEVLHVGPASDGLATPAIVVHRPAISTVRRGEVLPRLRWNIKNPALAGAAGDRWGDTHFIAALAEGLRGEGQEVVTARHGAHSLPTTAIDDVHLVIRGLDRGFPQPGKINVMWVISHPDAVSATEVAGFDLVFAASASWAERMTKLSGRPVIPMLQATDPRIFHPPTEGATRNGDVVFVGQARKDAPRTIVMDALDAALPVKVWGPRWSQHVPAEVIQSDFLENHRLGSLYRNAGIVLNDHWADMGAQGFVSNRIFDAVAAGARVITDQIDGVEELFEGAVRIYRTAEDLQRLSSPEAFPNDERRAAIARAVGREHSFARRARELLDAVLEFRAGL